MNRRRFLGVVGGASILVTGCLGQGSPPTPSPVITGSPDPTGSDTALCGAGYERVEFDGTVRGGPYREFTLTASADSVSIGEELIVRLENTAPKERSTAEEMTGNERKYLVERRTDEGWQSIFWAAPEETAVWNDEAVTHDPGEGFTWELSITRSGLEDGWYHVCEPLTPGSYRFIYFGLVDDGALETRVTVTSR